MSSANAASGRVTALKEQTDQKNPRTGCSYAGAASCPRNSSKSKVFVILGRDLIKYLKKKIVDRRK